MKSDIRLWRANSEDLESDDNIRYHRSLLRKRTFGGVESLEISKFVQYSVLLPPDNAINISKQVQYAVLVPPDNAVIISKSIQFVVLETVLTNRNDVYNKYARFFQKQTQPIRRRSKGSPLKKNLYVFTIT